MAKKDSSGKMVLTVVLIGGGALLIYYLLCTQNTAAPPPVTYVPKPVTSSGSGNIYSSLATAIPNIVNAL